MMHYTNAYIYTDIDIGHIRPVAAAGGRVVEYRFFVNVIQWIHPSIIYLWSQQQKNKEQGTRWHTQ